MKILVVSDTHRNYAVLKSIVDNNLDSDLIIHLGDGENEARDIQNLYPQIPLVYVKGNCDYGVHPESQVVTACGYKIFCCHGHNYDVHSGLQELVAAARAEDCQIALYGHTHLHRTEQVGDVFVMNPGSPDSPRNHNEPTYGVINLTSDGQIGMNIIAVKK